MAPREAAAVFRCHSGKVERYLTPSFSPEREICLDIPRS